MKTGMSVVGLIAEMVEGNPVIRALNFYTYTPQKNVSELSDEPSRSRLLFHDSPDGKEFRISREGILYMNQIPIEIGALKQGTALAVTSRIRVKKNQILHVPMVDFSDKGESKEQILADATYFLKKAGYKGAILFTGRSFHFYGSSLMSEREWRIFLGDCMLSGLADPRYIGHNLKDGYSTLRISACPPLRPRFPKVVALVL